MVQILETKQYVYVLFLEEIFNSKHSKFNLRSTNATLSKKNLLHTQALYRQCMTDGFSGQSSFPWIDKLTHWMTLQITIYHLCHISELECIQQNLIRPSDIKIIVCLNIKSSEESVNFRKFSVVNSPHCGTEEWKAR